MRRKELLAAGYVRDILFRNGDDYKLYIYDLDHRHVQYKILDSMVRDDGSVPGEWIPGLLPLLG